MIFSGEFSLRARVLSRVLVACMKRDGRAYGLGAQRGTGQCWAGDHVPVSEEGGWWCDVDTAVQQGRGAGYFVSSTVAQELRERGKEKKGKARVFNVIKYCFF